MPAAVLAVLTLVLGACSSDGDGDGDGQSDLVCGLVDRTLVEEHLTDDLEFRQVGDLSSDEQRLAGADCQLVNGSRTFLTATVVDTRDDAEHAKLRQQLVGERKALRSTCPQLQTTDPSLGYGSGCVQADGEVHLAVLTDDRLIRLIGQSTVTDVTVADLEAIAAAIDDNAGA